MNYILFTLLFLFPSTKEIKSVKNFHKVSQELYRSGQPQQKGMRELESMGIKTILNLRNSMDDKQEIKGTSLQQVRIPMRAKKIDFEDIRTALIAIKNAEKPVLVHCLHGSDRTGAVCAAYRMVVQNWSKEDAINEFLDEQYGYNQFWFPNILTLLHDLDVERLKQVVSIN